MSDTPRWTKQTIADRIASDDRALERGILAIYARQTADEQATEATRHRNGAGFTGADAELLSSFAKQIQRGRRLTAKQLPYARRKMAKYAGQLLRVAKERNGGEAPALPAAPCAFEEGCRILAEAGIGGPPAPAPARTPCGCFEGVHHTGGVCFRCGGKGYQDDADRRRNAYYDNHVRNLGELSPGEHVRRRDAYYQVA